MAVETHTLTVLSLETVADHLLQIRFSRPEGFMYQAGQFVQLLVPNLSPDGQPQTTPRSYSLSSTPADTWLEFGIKLHEGGLASTYFQTLAPGDTVQIKGPFGRFVNTGSDPLVGIATGAGLVPIFGLFANELINKKNQAAMHLIFGVRKETDIFWLDRLEQLAKDFSNFTFTLTLSQASPAWNQARGRVTEHLTLVPNARYFICGNPDMVKDARAELLAKEISSANIHLEIF